MCKCQLPRMIDPRPRPRRRSCSGAYCHQLGLSFCTQRRPGVCSNLLKNESLGFSAGNTSAQLVPRVFSLGSSSCCTLVTMLTIYPLVHHVMKKASNCVCSTLWTFHSSILKKTGITCMAIIIQFHDGPKSYSVLLGAVIIGLVYTPWQSLCLPIQSSSSYTVKMCFWGQRYPKYFLMEVRKLKLL